MTEKRKKNPNTPKKKTSRSSRGKKAAKPKVPRAQLIKILEEWRGIFDTLADIVIVLDTNGTILRSNRSMANLLNLPFKSFIGCNCREVFPDISGFIQELKKRKSRTTKIIEIASHWYSVAADPLRDAQGRTRGWVCIMSDISNKKRTDDLLRQTNQTLEALILSSPLAIFTFDRTGKIMLWNPAAEKIFGWAGHEAEGLFLPFVPSEKMDEAFTMIRTILAGRGFQGIFQRWRRKDHREINISLFTAPIRDGEGRIQAFMGIASDVSDQLKMEEELRSNQERLIHAQKMESLGQLAAGISHDFNNILTGIMGYADMALMHANRPHPLYDAIEHIRQLTDRGASITRKLLAFSRKQILEPRLVNLNTIIADMLKLLGKTLGENIDTKFEPDPALRAIHADPSQLEQVLMNLCLNARDAMSGGGKLIIRTCNVLASESTAFSSFMAKTEACILLEVSDTGCGMSREVMNKIFEPFFTTKEAGKGTGLGLAMVHGIIVQQGGFIDVRSEPGKGTSFCIFLPAATESAASIQEEEKKQLSAGGETILVVEDDEDVRELINYLLNDLGYSVISAREGEEGLRLFGEKSREISLIISDLVMPKFNGKELKDQIQSTHSQAKILFISGYSAKDLAHNSVFEGADFLPKPFSPNQLAAKVREILDRK